MKSDEPWRAGRPSSRGEEDMLVLIYIWRQRTNYIKLVFFAGISTYIHCSLQMEQMEAPGGEDTIVGIVLNIILHLQRFFWILKRLTKLCLVISATYNYGILKRERLQEEIKTILVNNIPRFCVVFIKRYF